jgi:hypothetical protein
VLRSIEALKALTVTDQWCQLRGEAAERAHDMLIARKDDLSSMGAKVEELLHPVTDAIHRLEGDQPMLSMLHGVIAGVRSNFEKFANKYPEIDKETEPADKRRKNHCTKDITLCESLEMDIAFFMRPAVLLASVLDPLNWTKNVAGVNFVPVSKLLSEDEQENSIALLADFCDGEDEDKRMENARVELSRLKCKLSEVLSA